MCFLNTIQNTNNVWMKELLIGSIMDSNYHYISNISALNTTMTVLDSLQPKLTANSYSNFEGY